MNSIWKEKEDGVRRFEISMFWFYTGHMRITYLIFLPVLKILVGVCSYFILFFREKGEGGCVHVHKSFPFPSLWSSKSFNVALIWLHNRKAGWRFWLGGGAGQAAALETKRTNKWLTSSHQTRYYYPLLHSDALSGITSVIKTHPFIAISTYVPMYMTSTSTWRWSPHPHPQHESRAGAYTAFTQRSFHLPPSVIANRTITFERALLLPPQEPTVASPRDYTYIDSAATGRLTDGLWDVLPECWPCPKNPVNVMVFSSRSALCSCFAINSLAI